MQSGTAPEFRGGIGSLFIATVLGASCAYAAAALSQSEPAPALAETAAATQLFTLKDSLGSEFALSEAKGKPVLVHFFATWCEPCRKELPALNRLFKRADGKLQVFAISVAEPGVRVSRFLSDLPVNFPVLLDSERSTARKWAVSTLPTSFVLNKELRTRFFVETSFDWDGIDLTHLEDMLATPSAQDKSNGG